MPQAYHSDRRQLYCNILYQRQETVARKLHSRTWAQHHPNESLKSQ